MRKVETAPGSILAGMNCLATPSVGAAESGISAKRLPVELALLSVMLLMTLGAIVGAVAVPPALPAVVMPFSVPVGWLGWVSV